ncbi:MAG: SHOCT domain-containing protein [Dehalogenimonas sp.]
MMYGWGPGWYGGFGGGWFMLLFWIVLIGLIVWGIFALTRHGRFGQMHMHSGGCCSTDSSTLDIARERYARGEISKDQFEILKKDLG